MIGGDFSYKCLGNDLYEVELTIYRNCECTPYTPRCGNYDSLAVVTIREGNGLFFDNLLMKLDTLLEREEVPLQTEALCLKQVPEVCVERSTGYRETIMLPPSSSGYTLTYMRCCRNTSTINIENPGGSGNTYLIEIPPSDIADCNSSPIFENLPPIILCAGYPFEFSHSAIDPDGDELIYKLCTPLNYPENLGDTSLNLDEAGPPPPFESVIWSTYFSVDNQIGGWPHMQIDKQTGLLTAFPDYQGRYVIGICVEERRNGMLMGTTIRDYQLKIIDCDVVQAEVEADEIDAAENFILNECGDYTVQFINKSEGTESFYWQFGDTQANGVDTSLLRNPIYEYPDTGRYEIMLIVNPGKLCADTANIILNLYPKMVVDFNWEETCAETAMLFTNTSTTDFGTFTNYSWSFGNGNTSNLRDAENIFSSGGSYDVFLTISNSIGCTKEIVKQVTVKSNPQVNFNNTPICLDQQPIIFSHLSVYDADNIENRDWEITDDEGNILLQANEANIEYTFTQPSNYNILLTATNKEGCIGTATKSFTLYEKLVIDAGIDRNVCIGDSVFLNSQINTAVTFMWHTDVAALIDDNTLQNPIITPFENTTVTVLVTDSNGCANSDSLLIKSQPLPSVYAGVNDSICLGDTFDLNGFAETTANGQVSYQWSPNNFIDNVNVNNPQITPESDITYYLTVTESEFNCVNTDSVFIKVVTPIYTSTNTILTICELAPIQLNAEGGEFYSWNPPIGLDDPTSGNPIATISETTNYKAEISGFCFYSEASILVNVQPVPNVDAGDDIELNVGDIIQLNATVGNIAETFEWLPNVDILDGGNTTNPELQPLQTRDYIITATSEFGCSLSDTVMVTVNNLFNLWIPNAFTPNDDGTNDEIGITSKGIKEIDVFRIYNRLGLKVFETNDINEKWDGTFKGQTQELGVYVYYVIGITFLDELFKDKGNITLIR